MEFLQANQCFHLGNKNRILLEYAELQPAQKSICGYNLFKLILAELVVIVIYSMS